MTTLPKLKDYQLAKIATVADTLSPDKRSAFLERLAARLTFRAGRFTDRDLDDAVRLALQGLSPGIA